LRRQENAVAPAAESEARERYFRGGTGRREQGEEVPVIREFVDLV